MIINQSLIFLTTLDGIIKKIVCLIIHSFPDIDASCFCRQHHLEICFLANASIICVALAQLIARSPSFTAFTTIIPLSTLDSV